MDAMASNSMSLDPQKLLPTERAAYLKCVTGCGDCRGEDCKISEEIEDNDSIDEQN